MSPLILQLGKGYISYGPTNILEINELRLHQGEVALIQGPNGSGKTSLFRALLAVGPVFSGDIVLERKDISTLSTHKRVQMGMRLLPQDRRVFGRLSPDQHKSLALHYLRGPGQRSDSPLVPTRVREKVQYSRSPAFVLSGGESKLMLLESFLIGSPLLLLLDEPFAGLEPAALESVACSVERCLTAGAACLVADHTGFAQHRLQLSGRHNITPSSTIHVLFELQ